uniref:Uncharacterized protein n=1 Tax=Mimivirus LCMiAC01 TaxID=2506608 RepID=A0A481Z106_9VIRU|nr:MAG: hypothetical protein LCMiAC01_04390 [Mimivirus LCMiAC01]
MDVESIEYPKTTNIKKWVEFLERKLTHKEVSLLLSLHSEQKLNKVMKKLYCACKERGLCMPKLTNLCGNCLFESLEYHMIGKSNEIFRGGLSYLMYIYMNYKNLIPGDSMTLFEKFAITNCGEDGTKLVVCKNKNMEKGEKKFYKYTYSVMCQDLTNNGSWSRLEPDLILTFISYIYKLNIQILAISNSGEHLYSINAYVNCDKKPELHTIYLANVDNFHYLPLEPFNSETGELFKKLYYKHSLKSFRAWAEKMEQGKKDEYIRDIYFEEQQCSCMQNEFVSYDSLDGDCTNYMDFD